MPVLEHRGLLHRSMELWCSPALRWPQSYRALVLTAPADADLLDPLAWQASEAVQFDRCGVVASWQGCRLPGSGTSCASLLGAKGRRLFALSSPCLISPCSLSALSCSAARRSATMLPAWMPGPVVSGGYLEGNIGKSGGCGGGLIQGGWKVAT